MSRKQPDPDCECKGRGWFALDMMATAYVPCRKCDTHEIVVTPEGFECVRLKPEVKN